MVLMCTSAMATEAASLVYIQDAGRIILKVAPPMPAMLPSVLRYDVRILMGMFCRRFC